MPTVGTKASSLWEGHNPKRGACVSWWILCVRIWPTRTCQLPHAVFLHRFVEMKLFHKANWLNHTSDQQHWLRPRFDQQAFIRTSKPQHLNITITRITFLSFIAKSKQKKGACYYKKWKHSLSSIGAKVRVVIKTTGVASSSKVDQLIDIAMFEL